MNRYPANTPKYLVAKVTKRVANTVCVALLAFFSLTVDAQTGGGNELHRYTFRFGSFDMVGVSGWFNNRFSEAELGTYRHKDFDIEQQLCSCYDRPVPHYPYVMMLFSTPKGDLVGRPERRGFDTVIIPLAVRFGERYCDVEAEDQCYGSFTNACDFSDFRYGNDLAPYFPDCLEVQSDTTLKPVYSVNEIAR